MFGKTNADGSGFNLRGAVLVSRRVSSACAIPTPSLSASDALLAFASRRMVRLETTLRVGLGLKGRASAAVMVASPTFELFLELIGGLL